MTSIKINFGGNFEDEFQKAVDEIFHLVSPALKITMHLAPQH